MSDAPQAPGTQMAPKQGAQTLAQLDLSGGVAPAPPPSDGGDQLGTRRPILIGSVIIAIFFGFFGFFIVVTPK